jgi:hypothetical protein
MQVHTERRRGASIGSSSSSSGTQSVACLYYSVHVNVDGVSWCVVIAVAVPSVWTKEKGYGARCSR